LGAYLIFFPMHYIGLMGVPRRYNELTDMTVMTESAHNLNSFISIMAFLVGFAQVVFLFNLIWSIRHGREAGGNPWRATTLEWQTAE
ncbi:MAG: cytochrome c oxidase subunit I, partial [Mesorhizobium sp.]